MTSRLSDEAEKGTVSIFHQGKDTVKIWRLLLIPFLRYRKHKMYTDRKKRFVKTSLFSAINRRSRDRIGRNFVSEYFEMTFWIENLTMFSTSDWNSVNKFPIAHSLSYNILKFGRKLLINNRDTGQKAMSCRFRFWKKGTSHRHITQIWKIMHCRF